MMTGEVSDLIVHPFSATYLESGWGGSTSQYLQGKKKERKEENQINMRR